MACKRKWTATVGQGRQYRSNAHEDDKHPTDAGQVEKKQAG